MGSFWNLSNKQSFFWICCIAFWDAWKAFEWVSLHYNGPSKHLPLNAETNYIYLAFILWLYFCQMNKQAHVLHPKGNVWLTVPNNQGEMMHMFFVGRYCFAFLCFNFAAKRAALGACCLRSKCPAHSETTDGFCHANETEVCTAHSCYAQFIRLPCTRQSCSVHRSEHHLRWTWNHSWW